ncbi:MAG: rod shape-determining protein MreC, partial [Gaiellaceae bacterium]
SVLLHPLTVAGERVARPFRDAHAYVDRLVDAETENEVLRAELTELRAQILLNQTAVGDLTRLERTLDYVSGATFPDDYGTVVARVIQVPSSPFRQEIVVAAGSRNGVVRDAAVISPDGLVGRVIEVAPRSAKVGLLTDPNVAVSATTAVSDGESTPATGVVRAGSSAGAGLTFDRVSKSVEVNVGEPVVTTGWRQEGLASLFPPDLRIGSVRSASRQDIDLYQRVQIVPAVDFESLQEVIILTETS